MNNPIHFVLLVLAFVCFVLSAWQAMAPIWNRLISVGLAALALAMVL
jgi:hypothetical protein